LALVLDASMAAAWLFADEQTPEVLAVLDEVTMGGAHVPALWHLEMASLLRAAERRGRCAAALADQLLASLASLPIAVDPETDRHAWHATRRLSREHDLTPYDAAYLELALRRGLPLATRDAALIAAARRCGVALLAA
jgi:predicted nucleic acid-binding protein